MNDFVQCIRADSRTINPVEFCGWEFIRRVAIGCGLGRVVFQTGATQVNSRLDSLSPHWRREFASAQQRPGEN